MAAKRRRSFWGWLMLHLSRSWRSWRSNKLGPSIKNQWERSVVVWERSPKIPLVYFKQWVVSSASNAVNSGVLHGSITIGGIWWYGYHSQMGGLWHCFTHIIQNLPSWTPGQRPVSFSFVDNVAASAAWICSKNGWRHNECCDGNNVGITIIIIIIINDW